MTPFEQTLIWLSAYKYLALFPLAVAEGPIITVIAGFFISMGYLNFWFAYVIIVAGDLIGDALHYLVGRFGGRKFVNRWGRYFGIGPNKVESLEKQFDKRGGKLLFIGKMSHGIGGAFLVAAGIVKMPFDKFILSNMLATLIKSLLLLLLGFYFGHALAIINTYLKKIALISIGAAIGAFLIYFFYFRKERKTNKRTEFYLEKKWLDTFNGRLCYFTGQKFPGRPTVVLLHGLSANHTTWNAAARAFAKMNLNCLIPDLRGHGHSDKSKKLALYKFPVFTQDLREILLKENLSKFILGGYSFGGPIAIDYAAKYPDSVDGLILISANYLNPLQYKRLSLLTWPIYFFLHFLAFILLWQKRKEYFYFDQETTTGYWASTFTGFTTMPISINLWMLSEIARIDLSSTLGNIACPTLIIKSLHDPFLSTAEAQSMEQKIKNSIIFIIQEKTHFLASEHQEKITKAIIDFIQKENLCA